MLIALYQKFAQVFAKTLARKSLLFGSKIDWRYFQVVTVWPKQCVNMVGEQKKKPRPLIGVIYLRCYPPRTADFCSQQSVVRYCVAACCAADPRSQGFQSCAPSHGRYRTQVHVIVQRLMQHGQSRDGLAATLVASDGKHVPGPLQTQPRSFMVIDLETVHASSTDLQSRE